MEDEARRISRRQRIALDLPKVGLEGKGNYAWQIRGNKVPHNGYLSLWRG